MNTIFGKENLVLDGAMGTQLIERGLKQGEASILWNLSHPDAVLEIQRSYIAAGADCLTASTFGGGALALKRYGLEAQMEALNRAGCRISREAAGETGKVLGDFGPCGEFVEPLGDLTPEELTSAIVRQADIMVAEGVDGFIVETMSDTNELAITVRALKKYGLPVFASYTYEKSAMGIQTMMGTLPGAATRAALEAGADVVGANCGSSLDLADYLSLGEQILSVTNGGAVLLQPNAGSPIATENGFSYATDAKAFGTWATEARQMGIRILGGCCGTTPSHIAAIRGA